MSNRAVRPRKKTINQRCREFCLRQCVLVTLAVSVMTYNLGYEQANYHTRNPNLDDSDITIMSYNVRGLDLDTKPTTKWERRKPVSIEMLNIYHPDVIGLQEPQFNQLNIFKELGYESYGEYIATSILYKKNKFKFVDGNTLWLSITPNIKHSISWDMDQQRVVTWILLQKYNSGNDGVNEKQCNENECVSDQYLVFNTHLDHIGETSRIRSCYLIKELIYNISHAKYGNKIPMFITGDFNSAKYSNVYDCFTVNAYYKTYNEWNNKNIELYDALHNATNLGNIKKLQYTYHAFHGLQLNTWYARATQYIIYGFSNSVIKYFRYYLLNGVCCMSCSLYHTIFQRRNYGKQAGVHHLDWILHDGKMDETNYFEVVTYHHKSDPDSNREMIFTPKEFFHDRIVRKTIYPSDHFPIITGFRNKFNKYDDI